MDILTVTDTFVPRLGQIRSFSSEIGKNPHTFWHWECGRISDQGLLCLLMDI